VRVLYLHNCTNTLPKYWLTLQGQTNLRQKNDEKGWVIANLQQTGKQKIDILIFIKYI